MNLILGLFIFFFGASIGSFLNVLIDRLPQERKITGRSVCDYCQHQLAWYDLIPIFSFFLLKGHCRYCRKKISFQYPLVEILTGLMFIFVFLTYVKNIQEIFLWQNWLVVLSLWGIVSCFIVIFFSDAKYHLISDYILWALFGFSFFYHLIGIWVDHDRPLQFLTSFIFLGLIIAFPIWLIYFLSKEKAMGLGDVYLAAILGFLLGWQKGFLALYLAFALGGIIGLFLILFGRKKLKSKIAFGPFLVIGALVMLFWGENILRAVLKIYGL
jgi:leader peptidase (prepilin peptidase)/N-methyltransferase